jgi:ADP-heptose:LPS heptosyltransferase
MSVLVLRALGIGDLATAVPALRGLRAARPTDEIVLAAPAWLAPLARLTGAVDRVVPVAGLDVPELPVPPPRLAVNLHGKGPRSHRLLAGARPERLLAYANPAAGFPYGPQWTDREHEVHRWCRMLSWYAIPAHPSDLALHPPLVPAAVPGATVLHPGAKDPSRRWPLDRFARLARELTRTGHEVVLTGSPAEAGLVWAVARRARLPAERVLAGRTDVAALAALVADARLVVCGDTGAGHLATGYGTPSVLLFGPNSPAAWGPLVDLDRHRVLWPAGSAGPVGPAESVGSAGPARSTGPARSSAAPRQRRLPRGPHPTLAAIKVDEVLAAVQDVEAQVDAATP